MNADGTGAHQLPNFQGAVKRPVFSPDSQQIAFEGVVSINGSPFLSSGILKMNADGTNVTRIPADGLGGNAPSWQPLPDPSPTPTPTPTPSYTISGRIALTNGQVFAPITVNVTGSRTASTSTDSNGNYSFTLPSGGTYTLTPVVAPLFTSEPPARTFTNLSANQTGADFALTRINYSISGHVTEPGGRPLSNLEITLITNGFLFGTARTGPDGAYAFNNLTINN